MDAPELAPIEEDAKSLNFLYKTKTGRFFLKLLTAPWVSKTAGAFLSCPLSKFLISGFVKKNGINLDEYQKCRYSDFNAFFSRQILSELRPLDLEPSHLMSPCDGLLSIYKINENSIFPVKQSRYSAADLLKDEQLAAAFDGGLCFVFRLCVNHYHRYAFCETGTILQHTKIQGKLHTVRPIALRTCPVFCENAREYDVIETENFGTIVQMEVGAMLVGKIDNIKTSGFVERGAEKGRFLYGGSTIIVLTQKDKVHVPQEYLDAAQNNCEIKIKLGMQIAERA